MSLKSIKPILRYDDQIEKIQELGIYIGDTEEEKQNAKDILIKSSYFFKLLSYRKNYEKDELGKYNISLNSLVDLAKLDMQLRYALLPYCLDIEHSLKTYLLRLITNKKVNREYSEDGYEIVETIFNLKSNPDNLKEQIFSGVRYYDSKKQDFIFREGYEKYYDTPPAWVVLDLASLGKLKYFVDYLSQQSPNNDTLKKVKNNIGYVSDVRNSCAHNTPVIFQLQKKSIIKKEIYTNAKRMGLAQDEIEILRVAKIFSVFELHRLLCSSDMRRHRNDTFKMYLERVEKTLELHEQNFEIKLFFKSLNKIIDLYKVEC